MFAEKTSPLASAALAALAIFSLGASAQEVHFAPEERLDAIDAALIGGAQHSIDFASYSLTDATAIDALTAAEGPWRRH